MPKDESMGVLMARVLRDNTDSGWIVDAEGLPITHIDLKGKLLGDYSVQFEFNGKSKRMGKPAEIYVLDKAMTVLTKLTCGFKDEQVLLENEDGLDYLPQGGHVSGSFDIHFNLIKTKG